MATLPSETLVHFTPRPKPLSVPPPIALEGRTPSEYILELCRMFPCLCCKVEGMTEFDGKQFLGRLRGCSTGEHHAAMFILNVWNPSDAEQEGWKFDFFSAYPIWDNSCRRAFLMWCSDPRWP